MKKGDCAFCAIALGLSAVTKKQEILTASKFQRGRQIAVDFKKGTITK